MGRFILKGKRVLICFVTMLVAVSCLRDVDDELLDYNDDNNDDIEDVNNGLPCIYIDVENEEEVTLKEYYNATIRIDGDVNYDDLSTRNMRIKCRGNFTYTLPKKAFKIKLDDAASLLGLKAEKDWVLLANYIDPAMSMTAAAMKLGEYMGVPYVNHIIPVNVIINGTHRGNYNLTESIEIKENRINLSDEGYVLEIDVYFDEDPKYYSSTLSMPVMLKDGNYTQEEFDAIIAPEFDEMEAAIMSDAFPNNNYRDLIDIESVAAFMLTNQYMMSNEVPSYKSIFFSKDKGGKFLMAPIWDFDFSSGYESAPPGALPFLSWARDNYNSKYPSSTFFRQFFKDPEFVELYLSKWNDFETNYKTEYLTYMDEYMSLIEESAEVDYMLWTREDYGFESYDLQRYRFTNWMEQRFYSLSIINSGL